MTAAGAIRRLICATLVLLSLSWLCFTLSSCARKSAGGELVVYTALEDDELAVYLEEFRKSHPEIKLKVVRDSTGVISAKLLAEKDNPNADVVWGLALTSLLVCDNAGMLKGYNPKGLDTIKPGFFDERNKQAHWVGIKAWMTGFVGNTIEMKRLGLSMPQSYEDLIDPQYRGHLVMPNPASSGTGYLTVSAILQLMGEERGWEYLDALDKNMAIYTHSGSKPAKLAGKGEFPIGISFAYRGFKQAAEGEPVAVTLPAEGSGWDLESNGLVKKGRIKPEALVFLDWAISPEMMRLYADVYPIVAGKIRVRAPRGYPDDPQKQLIKNDFQWAAMNRDRILKEWSRRYEGRTQ